MDSKVFSAEKRPEPAVVLVGNPNVGKSLLFSYLTGRYAAVSNYPGTTVEVLEGKGQFGLNCAVIDTPGANSLHPQSVDEKVARDILLSGRTGIVLQVADAKNLRRSLTMTTQLAEMGLPVVLALNMMDEAQRRGIKIHSRVLSEKIGIPVVETVAIEKRGFKKLLQHLQAGTVAPEITVHYPEAVEKGIEELLNVLPDTNISKRAVAVMLLANPDETRSGLSGFIGPGAVAAAGIIIEKVQKQFSQPLGYIIGVSRSKTVDRLLDIVFMKDIRELGLAVRAGMRKRQAFTALGLTAVSLVLYSFLGHEILTNWGLHPLLLHVVALMFLFTVLPYAMLEKLTTHYIIGAFFLMEVLYLMYKFVGVFGAGTLVNFIENNFFKAAVVPAMVSIIERAVPGTFFRDLLVGDYGLISMGLTYSIAIVMPIVATFFFAFGILEDSGYLPRLSVIADRIMRRVGLNGKAVLPMVLGLGCATMATLTARILDTRKERVIATLLLALGIPCSAQLGVIIAVVSQCSAAVTLTVVLVVLAQLLIVGTLSAKLIKSRAGDFIVELPPLRPPQLLNIILKTTHRMKWFLMEAVPLFLAGTLILFFVDRIGGLVLLERAFSPVIRGMLGLPEDSAFAFIVGFFRRDYGAAGLYDLFSTGRLNHNQVAVSMVVITLFVPCIANLLVMIKERGSGTAFAMAAFILPYAVLVGTVLNYFLRLTGIDL